MIVRVSLQPVAADAVDSSGIVSATPELDRNNVWIDVHSEGVCRRCRVSENLVKATASEGLKDVQWYFEQYIIKEPFAHARARTIARQIREQGKELLETFIRPIIQTEYLSEVHYILEVRDSSCNGATRQIPVQSFFWEVLEDLNLWQHVFGTKPAKVTVARVHGNHHGSLQTPTASSRPSSDATHVLAVTARPSQTKDIPHRLITRSISTAIDTIQRDLGSRATMEIVRPGTFDSFQNHIRKHPFGHFGVVHFDLHGDSDGNGARLMFVKTTQGMKLQADERSAAEVASVLIESGVRTVVINACRSAAGSNEASNIASFLVEKGIRVAVGMSFNVLSFSADQFMQDFYDQFLGQGLSPIAAVSHARSKLRQNTVRMSKYRTKINIEDHLVPVVHCQESEVEGSLGITPSISKLTTASQVQTVVTNLVGREGDILRLEWLLTQGEGSHIHMQGAPGVGKSKLLREAGIWWQQTGLFSDVIIVDLADAEFRNCTVDKIVRGMSSRLANNLAEASSPSLIAALNTRKILVVLDSVETIEWSTDCIVAEQKRQLRLFLNRLRNCSIIVLSRTRDEWLSTAIQSWIVLSPLNLTDSIALATGILLQCGLSSKVTTQDDQSYFEQLITISQGNPMAIKVIVYDLVQGLKDSATETILSSLLSLLQSRPVRLDEERLALDGGCRAVVEILEWIADDANQDSKMYTADVPHEGFPALGEQPTSASPEAYKALTQSIRTLRQNREAFNSMIVRPRDHRNLARCGFYSAMVFLGFRHNLPADLEPFITTLAILLVVRHYLDDEAFTKFRIDLGEYSEQGVRDSRWNYKKLISKEAYGLPPIVAHYCLYAATKSLAKIYDSREKDLSQFIDEPSERKFGSPGHFFTHKQCSISAILTLVSQSSIVRGLFPKSIREDVEIARDAQYRCRAYNWVHLTAFHVSSPYHEAFKKEFGSDFFNFIALMISYQRTDFWPCGEHWGIQWLLAMAATTDLRRARLIEHIVHNFVSKAMDIIQATKAKFVVASTGGYDTESQDVHYRDWSKAVDLEVAATNALTPLIYLSDLLQKPASPYLQYWNRLKYRPLFQVWKHTDPDVRNLVQQNIVVNSKWYDLIKDGDPLKVNAANDVLTEADQLRSNVAKLLNIKVNDSIERPAADLPERIMENTILAMGGKDMVHYRAFRIVRQIRIVDGKPDAADCRRAIQDLEALLAEEVENDNAVLMRMVIHGHLASVHLVLGNQALAVQHRAVREDLKSMLEPDQIEQMKDSQWFFSTYYSEQRRLQGNPVNRAEALALQLKQRQVELAQAESESPRDELRILSCIDGIGDTLRDLGRKGEAVEHYQRVIKGRERLLPENDKQILSVRFARNKLLADMHRYDESVEELRILRENYAEIGDTKGLNSVIGTMGLHLHRSVKWQRNSLTDATKQARMREAEALLEENTRTVEDVFEPGNVNISTAFSNLASLHKDLGNFEKAESLYQSAIRVHLTRTNDYGDRSLILSRNNLASLWKKMGKLAEAEKLYRSLLEACIERHEIWNDVTCMVIGNLYDTYEVMGLKEKCASLISDCVARFDRSLAIKYGPYDLESPEAIDAKYRVGRALSLCDAHSHAIRLLPGVLTSWQKRQKFDEEYIDMLERLRYSYASSNPRQIEAEHEACVELVRVRSQLDGDSSSTTLDAIGLLVVSLRHSRKFNEAIAMQIRLVEGRKMSTGLETETALGNMAYLAEMYSEVKDWPKAIKVRRELYSIRWKMDSNDRKTVSQASHIAVLHEKMGHWDRVIDLRKQEVADWRRIEGGDSINALTAMSALEWGLESLGNLPEAQATITEVIALRTKILGPNHRDTLEAQRIKSRICRKAGNLDKAQHILDEILAVRARSPANDDVRCLALCSLSGVYMEHHARDSGDIQNLQKAVHCLRESLLEDRVLPSNGPHRVALAEMAMTLARKCINAGPGHWDDAELGIDAAAVIWRTIESEDTDGAAVKIRECEALKTMVNRRRETCAHQG